MKKILSLVLGSSIMLFGEFIEYKVSNEQIFINPHEIVSTEKSFSTMFDISKTDFEDMITDRLNLLANEIKEKKIKTLSHNEFRMLAKKIVNKTHLTINFNTQKEVIVTHLELDKQSYMIVVDMPISINNIDEDFLSPFVYNITFYEFDKIILNELLIYTQNKSH